MWRNRRCLQALGRLVLASVLVACGMRTPEETPSPTATRTPKLTPTAAPSVFRSEQYHLTVDLPLGWAAAEGPRLLAKPYGGLVAFNSWGEHGFWATWIETKSATGTSYWYDRDAVLSQLPDGGAYVVLIHEEGPFSPAEAYGPEYERQDLGGLSLDTGAGFCKWGRRLRIEVYRHPHASAETSQALDALLQSWRFDRVPVGGTGWAILQARQLLPPEVEPLAFPLRDGRYAFSGSVVRSVQAEAAGDTVLVTFTYRWDAPTRGVLSDDCPSDRCRWWRFEARPSGEVVLVEEGGTGPPTPTPAPPPEGEVDTPEYERWVYETWPAGFKFAVDDEVVVLFADPGSMAHWIGPTAIKHIPSVSTVVLDDGGSVVSEQYGSEKGRKQIAAVLDNHFWQVRIRNQVDQIWSDALLDYGGLLEMLEDRGVTVEPGEQILDPFFSVEGKLMVVNGAEVGVFEYPGPATAAFEAGRISPDGNTVMWSEKRVSHSFWVATPHFYHQGKLIVLYVGDDRVVLGALEAVLDKPFAGG
jgi:hypothetical protein